MRKRLKNFLKLIWIKIIYCFAVQFIDVKLTSVNDKGNELEITLMVNRAGGTDSLTRYAIVKLEKKEYKEIKFVIKRY